MNHCALPHHLYVWVDNKFLDGSSGVTRAVLHSLSSRPGQVVMGHVLLESGAHWSGVPLHGIFCSQATTCEMVVADCQPWGAMGDQIFVTHMPYLEGLKVEVFSAKWQGRSTGLVVDWRDGFSRHPEQHKPLHLLEMDTGHYSLQPNNYLRWGDPSFVEEDMWTKAKGYRRNNEVWWPEG